MARMYETYVPIPEPIEERKPPTIADIVRQKTDGGAMIIDFFTDVMTGRVDDARLCHRIDAAKQLVKYGHKDAAGFIADHGDEPCDHCESRKRGPRSPKGTYQTPGVLHAQAITYDFLNLLTEDFLTVLSAVDEDLMIMLVRAQTAHGETVVEFLNSVMSNRVEGFKAHHRIAAARELISHIIRDEQRSHTPCPSTPVGAGFKPALPGTTRQPGNLLSVVPASNLTVVPAQNGTQHTPLVVPAKAGTQKAGGADSAEPKIVRPEPVEGQCSAETTEGPEHTGPVVPAKTGFLPQEPSPTQTDGGADGAEPKIVRPEPVEGQCSAETTEGPEHTTPVVPAKAGFLPQEPSPTQTDGGDRSAADNSVSTEPVPSTLEGSQLETNNSKLETLPGRSPPK